MNTKKLRVKAIKLFGHLSPETEEILETQCYISIVKHLGKYDKEVFPILLKHKDDIPAEFWYHWGRYVGYRDVAFQRLLEIGDPKWLTYWGINIGDKDMVFAKLLKIGNPQWLCYWAGMQATEI